MNALLKRLSLAALICAAIMSPVLAGPSNAPPEKDADEEEEQPNGDMTDLMLKAYADGTMKAMYAVSLHADPKEGQYWKVRTTSKYEETEFKTSESWLVAKVVGKKAIIEHYQNSYGIVVAYLCDTSVSADDMYKKGNVLKAWVGKKGEEPTEITVMEVPTEVEAAPPAEKNFTNLEEEFKDVEQAGGKWSGKKITMKMNDGSFDTTSWTADNGWFNKVIKLEYKFKGGAGSQELVKFTSKGKAMLKWDKIKIEEDKKEEPKKDEGGK